MSKILIAIAACCCMGMVRGEVVWTEWKRPLINTDGSPLTDLKGYAIYITSDNPRKNSAYSVFPILAINQTVVKWPFLVGDNDCFYVQIASINNKNIESVKTDKVTIKGKGIYEKNLTCSATPSATPHVR